MSDTKKLAYMIAALETSQAEISVATADMKDTARDCKIYASKLRDTTNMDIIEIERRLTIGTEAFIETVKKETVKKEAVKKEAVKKDDVKKEAVKKETTKKSPDKKEAAKESPMKRAFPKKE